jgi:hypothetical protein
VAWQQAVGVDGEATELGQLADQDRQRQPVHVAQLRRARQKVATKPNRSNPATTVSPPTSSASTDA